MVKILSIGEVMLEMSDMGGGLYRKSFAGDTFNMAHYLNVVTEGQVRADYLTALGEDAQSAGCLEFLTNNGVNVTRCVKDTARTIGLFILSNDEAGEKQYGYWRGQSAARHLFDEVRDLSGYDLIYFSGITAAITEKRDNLITSLRRAKEQGADLAYDFNFREKLWPLEAARDFAAAFLPFCNLVKISDEELDILYPGQDLEALSRRYPAPEWVLTCGGIKGEVWSGGTLVARQTFEPVGAIVDSSAAGDSFIATYIAGKIAGETPLQRLRRGHAIASQVVCGKGSIVPVNLTKLD